VSSCHTDIFVVVVVVVVVVLIIIGGYCSWLKHYVRSQKVTGLIPDEVIGFFN
jgi:hypothetical protein